MTFMSTTYEQEFNTVVANIHDQAADTLIQKVIGQPRIPHLAVAMQFLFFKEHRYSLKQIRDYCTSTALVHMGLDIHNEVSPDNETPHRQRQLQVLAGDLYSGKFYQILAHRGDVRVIHFLADAVSYVNQARTNLYDLIVRNQLSVKQYVQEIEKICTALLKSWLRNEPIKDCVKWDKMVSNLLTAEKLISDYLSGTLPANWHQNANTQLQQKAWQLIGQSRLLVQDWTSQETKRELEHLIDVTFPAATHFGKIAEEC